MTTVMVYTPAASGFISLSATKTSREQINVFPYLLYVSNPPNPNPREF